MADYQGCARATEPETTRLVERTGKIGHPQGPVVFLLRYHISKTPNPHGPFANDTSWSFQRAVTLFEKPSLYERFAILARGVGGSFQSTAKASLIPWIGSVALKFVTEHPQKKVSFPPVALSASTELMIRALGALRERW